MKKISRASFEITIGQVANPKSKFSYLISNIPQDIQESKLQFKAIEPSYNNQDGKFMFFDDPQAHEVEFGSDDPLLFLEECTQIYEGSPDQISQNTLSVSQKDLIQNQAQYSQSKLRHLDDQSMFQMKVTMLSDYDYNDVLNQLKKTDQSGSSLLLASFYLKIELQYDTDVNQSANQPSKYKNMLLDLISDSSFQLGNDKQIKTILGFMQFNIDIKLSFDSYQDIFTDIDQVERNLIDEELFKRRSKLHSGRAAFLFTSGKSVIMQTHEIQGVERWRGVMDFKEVGEENIQKTIENAMDDVMNRTKKQNEQVQDIMEEDYYKEYQQDENIGDFMEKLKVLSKDELAKLPKNEDEQLIYEMWLSDQ